jgi:hypothetical protein
MKIKMVYSGDTEMFMGADSRNNSAARLIYVKK